MNQLDDPAMPHGPLGDTMHGEDGREWHQFPAGVGMSLRQYAAIHLRVPDSGIPDLDAMIRQARRQEMVGRALQGIITNGDWGFDEGVGIAFQVADAAIKAMEGKP